MITLRKAVNEKDEESRKRQSLLDAKLQELELIKQNLEGKLFYITIFNVYQLFYNLNTIMAGFSD